MPWCIFSSQSLFQSKRIAQEDVSQITSTKSSIHIKKAPPSSTHKVGEQHCCQLLGLPAPATVLQHVLYVFVILVYVVNVCAPCWMLLMWCPIEQPKMRSPSTPVALMHAFASPHLLALHPILDVFSLLHACKKNNRKGLGLLQYSYQSAPRLPHSICLRTVRKQVNLSALQRTQRQAATQVLSSTAPSPGLVGSK